MSDFARNSPYLKILGDPRYPYQIPLQEQEYLRSQQTQTFDHTRRIIDLETRIAALEAALDKLTGEK